MSLSKYYKLHYWLKNAKGDVVDSSEGGEPMSFTDDSGHVIPGLIKAVQGRSAGDRIEVTIPPELAYGEHRPELVNSVPKSMFDGVENIAKGMKFQTNTGSEVQIVQVVDIDGTEVTVDANHPLAGLTLVFELDILEVRNASEDELEADKFAKRD